MEAEDLTLEAPDRDHRADATREIEDHSADHREGRIHMFLVGVADADEMIAEDRLRRNQSLLRLSGQNPSHVHHLAVGIVQPQDLAHQHLVDADQGHQIDVVIHTEEEEAEVEGEVRIVELAEDHLLLRLPVLVLPDHLSGEDPPRPHP